jgi:Holliday junction resolvase-like predicted endonuclease
VARRAGLLVIVEVRTRGANAYEGALASVSVVKRRRLLTASHRLLAGRLVRDVAMIERVRIDVASVAFKNGVTTVEYIAGAIVDD